MGLYLIFALKNLMSTDYNRVFIVEDEFTTLSVLEGVAKSAGFQVVGTASNSAGAIQNAITARPDLLIMDILFPKGVDGIEAAKQIQDDAKDVKLDLGIVFVTSQTDPATKDRALKLNPYAFVEKPFARDDLKQTLVQVLDERRFPNKRDRRVQLILKDERGVMTADERAELEKLEASVHAHVTRVAPIDFTIIETLEAKIKGIDR
jgi:DNA-binding NarL/FixJ family response regulator